ncbi:hypothetical protein NFI00_000032 [Salmonella enterica]|nr:hypothetical protein [Salmonella enterica]
MNNENAVAVPPALTKGQQLARLDRYGPECSFYKDLVAFADTADTLYARLAISRSRQHNIQIRAALSKLSQAVDWTITVLKQDIISYE